MQLSTKLQINWPNFNGKVLELHFIPSHTNQILESDEIDELAKLAVSEGEEINHDPLLSSYKLKLRKLEKQHLDAYLKKRQAEQIFELSRPHPTKTGYKTVKRNNQTERIKLSNSHPLLNRARTGHS